MKVQVNKFNQRIPNILVTWDENIHVPKQTTHAERKKFWTQRGSYNTELINRISEIKLNNQ